MYQLNAMGDPGLDPTWRKEVCKKEQKWNINMTGYDSVAKRAFEQPQNQVGTLNAYYQVKEASLRRLHAV